MKIALIVLCLASALILFTLLPTNYADWIDHFRPAALSGWRDAGSLYVYNPPWTVVILYPLALLPPRLGAALVALLSIAVLSAYLRRPARILAAAASPAFVYGLSQGQIEALALLGLMVPGGLGLPLLLIKPQGVLLAGARRLNSRSLALTGAVVGLSLVIWGIDWLLVKPLTVDTPFNLSLFPYSLAAVPPLFYLGIRRRDDGLLCLASLALAPYFSVVSLLPAVAALIRRHDEPRVWVLAVAGAWAFLLLPRYI